MVGTDYLKQFAGVNYTGENLYMDEPAVRAGNIITANGFATLEFCREILYALEADSSQKIEREKLSNEQNRCLGRSRSGINHLSNGGR